MTDQVNAVAMPKWEALGFTDKHHYVGWLQFNDLADESMGFDDTYKDEYTGKTVRLGKEVTVH
ncbi:hypothetical protein [Burkholderia pseudomallei]|jgi:hypothetical protein|uniref:hypothetical protein n=1 Tax=Burkholderia pseudomallei TaxID=28450 RepID=UPI0024DFACF2|nr:hypothetical protein [Burkholderia pseudomallei]